jgi:hypothetical protein
VKEAGRNDSFGRFHKTAIEPRTGMPGRRERAVEKKKRMW